MDIIYNESKAIESYEQYKSKKRLKDIIHTVASISGVLGVVLITFLAVYRDGDPKAIFYTALIVTGISLAVIAFSPTIYIPLDAAYYVISKSNKILEVQTSAPLDKGTYLHHPVIVVAESQEGSVEEHSIGTATLQNNTRFSSKTLDLHQGIIFTPYVSLKSEKEQFEKSKADFQQQRMEFNEPNGCALCSITFDRPGELKIDLKKDGYGECRFCPGCGRSLD